VRGGTGLDSGEPRCTRKAVSRTYEPI
jgi:hypothetical protein